MQKTIFAASLAAVMGMGGAQAADLSRGSLKDAPVYTPANSWTGFYLGVGGGLGATNQDLKGSLDYSRGESSGNIANADLNGAGGEGGFGTVQVGYDRQLDQHFVAGLFFDYDFASIESKASVGLFGNNIGSISSTLTDSWTVGGRLGYLVNSNTLVYGLAGYTEAHFDNKYNLLTLNGSLPGDYTGWTAGAGIETNLGGSWYLKGEYRFTALDEKTLASGAITKTISYKFTDQPDVQSGRLVLSYKLNGTSGYESLK
jgi:outer membrane immunogenic protein